MEDMILKDFQSSALQHRPTNNSIDGLEQNQDSSLNITNGMMDKLGSFIDVKVELKRIDAEEDFMDDEEIKSML
eukprot:403352884